MFVKHFQRNLIKEMSRHRITNPFFNLCPVSRQHHVRQDAMTILMSDWSLLSVVAWEGQCVRKILSESKAKKIFWTMYVFDILYHNKRTTAGILWMHWSVHSICSSCFYWKFTEKTVKTSGSGNIFRTPCRMMLMWCDYVCQFEEINMHVQSGP